MGIKSKFDVIVIGGGHAGIEAAHAASKMGSKTLLITLEKNKIGLMPCNPAIGGVGKGHIVFEISALGGLMPKLCSKTYIQARMLNTKKGPAVQGLRLQIDKFAYSKLSRETVENMQNLSIFQGMANKINIDNNNHITGITTACSKIFESHTVILTAGTFLNGTVHIGKENHSAGRFGEKSVKNLTKSLVNAGIKFGRLKTGTPPRLLESSLDWKKMDIQQTANLNYLFEFYPKKVINTHNCFITRTTKETHDIIKQNLELSAMYSGNITGTGPRYCPSIEDKIAKFPDKESHNIFVEPEGQDSEEIYPNGISTSLPRNIQEKYIRSIPGFENAIITKYGYAIEYDFFYPEQLQHTLESKTITGLFLAGQINGTTGYEEAAAQGLIAGINANLKSKKMKPFVLDRNQSYIGVMIDDLVSIGTDEPYRMFTSRAERRLFLRQDNVFLRLTGKGYNLGLIDQELYYDFKKEKKELETTLDILRKKYSQKHLLNMFETKNSHKTIIKELTKQEVSEKNSQIIYAEIKYEPYLERELLEIKKRQRFKMLQIPNSFQYKDMPGLSSELQQKLIKHKPKTIAQAALIPGITPAAISLLIFKTREYSN